VIALGGQILRNLAEELKRVKVAVVEDDFGMRQAIARILSAAGMFSQAFPSAEDFLNAQAIENFDVLVVDIRLPGMSGFNMVRGLINRGIRRPVIFITSHDEVAMKHEAFSLGGLDFLSKPFLGTALLESLGRVDGTDYSVDSPSTPKTT